MKKPDKVGIHTPYPGAKQYLLHFYESENCVYIFHPEFDEPMIKYGPINDKTHVQINTIARKAARYLRALELDRERMEAEGFEFLAAPHWLKAGAKPALKKKDVMTGRTPNAPKWL